MRAIIDRREGEYFIVERDDGTILQIPAAGAPANAREGAVIELQAVCSEPFIICHFEPHIL